MVGEAVAGAISAQGQPGAGRRREEHHSGTGRMEEAFERGEDHLPLSQLQD